MTQSVENPQKDLFNKEPAPDIDVTEYLYLPDAESTPYQAQPRRKYGTTVVRGLIVGRGENQQIIPLEQVRKLASLHLTYADMAEFFGVKENTFRDHFRFEVERARQTTKQRLMEAMLETAIVKMNPTIQIWLSKNLLGFTDSPVNAETQQILPWQITE